MNLLQGIFGKRPPAFNRRKEWEKLKNNLSVIKWQSAEGKDFSGINSGFKDMTPVLIGSTQIKEVAGIAENKLRVFGMETPKHFACKRNVDSDEYCFYFSDAGIALLAKKGVNLLEKKS